MMEPGYARFDFAGGGPAAGRGPAFFARKSRVMPDGGPVQLIDRTFER